MSPCWDEPCFQDRDTQESRACATQMNMDISELVPETLTADAVIAVDEDCRG